MPESSTKRFALHEDWVVVILGFLVILFSLFLYIVPVPVFKWDNGTSLAENVLTPDNLGTILIQRPDL